MGGACNHVTPLSSNERHGNTELVQTGFVLIFQCINYKNIRLHYTFAILLSNWSVVVLLSLRKAKKKKSSPVFYGYIFVSSQFIPVSNMVKTKKSTPPEERRTSQRLAKKPKPAAVEKKKAVAKRAPKAKKPKQAENGSTKAEEPKAEATDAK